MCRKEKPAHPLFPPKNTPVLTQRRHVSSLIALEGGAALHRVDRQLLCVMLPYTLYSSYFYVYLYLFYLQSGTDGVE